MENKTILIIEDDKLNMKLFKVLLQHEKYHILEAFDAEKGIELARKQKVDLILMDIQLPDMDGLDATRIIKEDPELKDIPVIIISNSGQPVEIDRAQKLGAKDWLVKTEFDPQEVIDKIKKQIG